MRVVGIDDIIESQSVSVVLSFAVQGRVTTLEVYINPGQTRRLFLPDTRTKPNATKLALEAQFSVTSIYHCDSHIEYSEPTTKAIHSNTAILGHPIPCLFIPFIANMSTTTSLDITHSLEAPHRAGRVDRRRTPSNNDRLNGNLKPGVPMSLLHHDHHRTYLSDSLRIPEDPSAKRQAAWGSEDPDGISMGIARMSFSLF